MIRNFFPKKSKIILIDIPVKGWANIRKAQLFKRYKEIRVMGERVELPKNMEDIDIIKYCKDNSCDLLTKDKRAYTFSFKVSVKKVLIERYGIDEGHKNAPVFILHFID